MDTRATFSPLDFAVGGGGQYVIRDSFKRGRSKDFRFASSVAYKLCYWNEPDKTSLFLASLTDGMLIQFVDLEAVCRYLNEDEEGFRPLEPDELVEVVRATGNRFFEPCFIKSTEGAK